MGLAYFLEVIRRRWWVVAVSILLCTGSSYLLASRTPTWYEATTTVRVPWAHNLNDHSTDLQQVVRRYQNLIREPAILEGAAQAAGLPYVPSPDNVSARVVLEPDSYLLEIIVRDTDPEHARALADAIAQQVVLREKREEEAAQDFMQSQLRSLEESIQRTEDEIGEEAVKLTAADNERAIQQHQGDLAALQEKLASLQSTHASLVEFSVNRLTRIAIEQPARRPVRPIRTLPVPQTLLLAAALGLILGLAGAFFLEFRAGGRAKDRESTAAGGGS
jgi:capsular polysaccharide biosynthesis protein